MSEPNPRFRVLQVIRENDGVCAEITEKVESGHISFHLFKEWTINKSVRRSNFFSRRHVASIRKLMPKILDQLEAIEDQSHAEHRAQSL